MKSKLYHPKRKYDVIGWITYKLSIGYKNEQETRFKSMESRTYLKAK